MPIPRKPVSQLDTHEVANQPPPFVDVDLYSSDRALLDAVTRAGAGTYAFRLSDFGRRTGSAEVLEWAEAANTNLPKLETHDRYGRRLDEVSFHPAYHQLMTLGLNEGVAAAAWDGSLAGHTLHAAISFLLGQA